MRVKYGRMAQNASRQIVGQDPVAEFMGEDVKFRVPSGGLADIDILGFNPATARYLGIQTKYEGRYFAACRAWRDGEA
jgi:hypothetical protein